MKLLSKIKEIFKIKVVYTVEKMINTLIWVITPQNKVIVVNGFIRHRGKKVLPYNFGDDINYAIVETLSHKRVISYKHSYVSIFKPVNYMCIGSIVDYLANEKSIVWGSGAIGFNRKLDELPKKILAVRGPKTRDYLLSQGIECPEVFGDPALLLPLIYSKPQKKHFKIGVIPHIVDLENKALSEFIKRNDTDCIIIDFAHYSNWKSVIDKINQCEIIVSSSLHGLIISDAYNIPNVWVQFSNKIIGDNFKYYDYFTSVGRSNSTPILCVCKELEYNEIIIRAKEWSPIHSDIKKLLCSCPFLKSDEKMPC